MHEGGQQPGQHAQVGLVVALCEVAAGMRLEQRHPVRDRLQAGADEDDGIGRSGGGAERAARVTQGQVTQARAFELLQRLRRIDCEVAITQPVPGVWRLVDEVGRVVKNREDGVAHQRCPSLRDQVGGLGIDALQRFGPGFGGDQQRDRGVTLTVGGEHAGRPHTQGTQRRRGERLARPGAQKRAEQGMEGVGRLCAVAAFGEEAAAGEIG